MIAFALKLVLAHLLGDFVLQPSKWVTHKKKYILKSKYLYYHIGVHFLLLLALTSFKAEYFLSCLSITILHLTIDVLKLQYTPKKHENLGFIIDQIMHFLVIVCVVHYFFPFEIVIYEILTTKHLLLVSCLVTVTFVSGIIMKMLLAPWTKSIHKDRDIETMPSTGKYLGMLERVFIFLSVITGFWEGVGFLLTAKSILRLSTTKESKNMKLSEYILIGTFLSFGLGILIALIYKVLLKQL